MKKIILSFILTMVTITSFGQDSLIINDLNQFEISKVFEINASKEQIFSAIKTNLPIDELKNIIFDKEEGIIKYENLQWVGLYNIADMLYVNNIVKIKIKDNKYKVTFTITNIYPNKKIGYKLYWIYPNINYDEFLIKSDLKNGTYTNETLKEINKQLNNNLNKLTVSQFEWFNKYVKIEDDF